jgi:hypothetical protein
MALLMARGDEEWPDFSLISDEGMQLIDIAVFLPGQPEGVDY